MTLREEYNEFRKGVLAIVVTFDGIMPMPTEDKLYIDWLENTCIDLRSQLERMGQYGTDLLKKAIEEFENIPIADYIKLKNKADKIDFANSYAENKYKVGDIGPSGGYVFYDKGEYTDGWRYLEANKRDAQAKMTWDNAKDIGKYCSNAHNWRLPTKTELNLMYENLHKKGLGGFSWLWYWSSSEYFYNFAWVQYFGNGIQSNYYEDYTSSVRAVRQF